NGAFSVPRLAASASGVVALFFHAHERSLMERRRHFPAFLRFSIEEVRLWMIRSCDAGEIARTADEDERPVAVPGHEKGRRGAEGVFDALVERAAGVEPVVSAGKAFRPHRAALPRQREQPAGTISDTIRRILDMILLLPRAPAHPQRRRRCSGRFPIVFNPV